MAKQSIKARQRKRERMVAHYAEKRKALKEAGDYQALDLLPKNSSKVRLKNRCQLTGRGKGYMRHFAISRVTFREMALNGLIQKGVPTDWVIHAIGHELTAHFGIDHARTLAIIAPSHYRYNFESKKQKLAQFAERVWNVKDGSLDEKATIAIEKMESFFHSLNIPTKLSQYTSDYQGIPEKIEKTFIERNWLGLGEHKNIKPSDVRVIVENSI